MSYILWEKTILVKLPQGSSALNCTCTITHKIPPVYGKFYSIQGNHGATVFFVLTDKLIKLVLKIKTTLSLN